MVLLFFLVPLAAGCLQVETTVRVESDGSGTITERLVMSNEAVDMLSLSVPEGETFTLMDEERLREGAAGFGDGVRFDSAEGVRNDFGRGYVVRYAFDDVTKLRLNLNASEKVPGGEPVEPAPEPDYVTFTFEASSPNTLTVNWPVDRGAVGDAESGQAEAAPEDEPREPSPDDLEMAKAFMEGMRMAMYVETAGEIVETNATHRQGSRITLLDYSFDALLASPDGLKAMMMAEPETLAEAKDLIARIPGVALETEPQVTIRFR